jgi:hypothetical protein
MISKLRCALVACVVAQSAAGCGGKLSEPSAPPPGASMKSVPAIGAAMPLGHGDSAEPHWVGADRWTEPETAVDSLGRIGPASLPALVELLHGQDEHLRIAAARAIAVMGPEAKPAVPDLTAALSDASAAVRKNVIRALGQMGPAAEPAIDALVKEARRVESPLDQQIDRDRLEGQPRVQGDPPVKPTSAPAKN